MTCFLSHIKEQNSYFLYLSWLMCLFWEKSLPLHFCVLGKHPNRHKELQMTTPSHLLLHGSHVLLCSIGFSREGSFSDWVDGKRWHLLGSKEIICFCTLDSIPSRGRMKLKKQKKPFILCECSTSKEKVNSHTFNYQNNIFYRELCIVSIYTFQNIKQGFKILLSVQERFQSQTW